MPQLDIRGQHEQLNFYVGVTFKNNIRLGLNVGKTCYAKNNLITFQGIQIFLTVCIAARQRCLC